MDFASISLVFLILTIIIGLKTKLNVGLIALTMSYILCRLSGTPEIEMIRGFNTGLFLMLLGVMILFGVAQVNGTMELIAKKITALTGSRTYLIPFVIYCVSILISSVGTGTLAGLILMSVFSMSLAKEMKVSPLLLGAMAFFGTNVGGVCPVAVNGIILDTLAREALQPAVSLPIMISEFIAITILVVLLYFYYGGHKINVESPFKLHELPSFSGKQKITLLGIVFMVFCVFAFKSNVGLISFFIATFLLLIHVADSKAVLGTVGWNTIILITGFGVFMKIIISLGGIALLAKGIGSFITPFTAPAFVSLTSSLMAMFCSVSGVVLPTIATIIPDILNSVGTGSYPILMTSMSVGAHIAGISPFTGGAILLSAYETILNESDQERERFYQGLMKLAGFVMVFAAAVAVTGIFNLI